MNTQYPDEIVTAWNEFKGSPEHSTIPEADEILATVDTARTTRWKNVDAVAVYTNPNVDLPDAFFNIIDRNNLVQIGEQSTTHDLTMYFTTKSLADENNLSTAHDFSMKTSPENRN